MAKFFWRGASSTTWKTGLNWIDNFGLTYPAARWPGSIAAVFDEVYLDAAVTNGIDGVDLFGTGAEDLALFRMNDAYNKHVGSSGTYLIFECRGEVMLDGTSAQGAYLQGGTGDAIASILLTNWNSSYTLNLKGKFVDINLLKGTVYMNTGVNITGKLAVLFKDSMASDVTLTIATGCTVAETHQLGGVVYASSPMTTRLLMLDGIWRQSAGTQPVVVIFGGLFDWRAGDINDCSIFGGALDATQSDTERAIVARLYRGTLDLRNYSRSITPTVKWFGGDLLLNPGVTVAGIGS